MIDTKKLIIELEEKFRFKNLPIELGKVMRLFYASQIKDINIENKALFVKNRQSITQNIERIVIGDYGAYFEIKEDDITKENIKVKPGEEYRINNPRYKNRVKYHHLCPKENENIKIYHQMRTVTYADYKPGMYYISVFDENLELKER